MTIQIDTDQFTGMLTKLLDGWRLGGVLAVDGHLGVLIHKADCVVMGQGKMLSEAFHDALMQTFQGSDVSSIGGDRPCLDLIRH